MDEGVNGMDGGPVALPNFIDNRSEPIQYTKNLELMRGRILVGFHACDISNVNRNLEDARGDDVYEQALLSPDDVLSSQGTEIGRDLYNDPFVVVTRIKEFTVPYNQPDGYFDIIKNMIHVLFFRDIRPPPPTPTEVFQGTGVFRHGYGFVGITRAGILSEYTATIYYATTESSRYYENIIKIMVYYIDNLFSLDTETHNGIIYSFKLDRGVKPGDTIKLILSLTFGEGVGANVILIPILNIVGFNLSSTNGAVAVTSIGDFTSFYRLAEYNLLGLTPRGSFSIFDLIARIRLYANQEAFGALIEPTDNEKELMRSFFASINPDNLVNGLAAFIQFIKFAFYTDTTDTRIPNPDKNFAFFLNIFFNFYKVSMNAANSMESLSTAKLMYTNFFSQDNNYGSIIRIFNNMMTRELYDGTPLNEHAIMFLSGSNAARAYKLIQEITHEENQARREQIYDTHMATLSDNDFMFYLLNEGSEPYRLAIRMMLGACLYYLKYILNDAERGQYTNLLEESISIVGHDDHLLAQRLDANADFLQRCFNTITSYTTTQNTIQNVTISNILGICNIHDTTRNSFNFYQQLSGNVTLAFLDVVFKHNTAEKWYISVFSIFGITPIRAADGTLSYRINILEVTSNTAADGTISYTFTQEEPVNRVDQTREVLTFLTTKAMAVNCIATPWTLILNILYTIFVTENCVARIVVGKLGNDPKNLEKYFSILNTHLNYLPEQYNTQPITEEKRAMIDKITRIRQLQTYIIHQSQLCQRPESIDSPLSTRYETLKSLCKVWVQQMFILALEPATRELFFLSAAYTFTRRQATPLEKGICCAWKFDGNICNRGEFLQNFNPTRINTRDPGENFQPVYIWESMSESEQIKMSASERGMHHIVQQLQRIINGAIDTIKAPDFNVTPNPPLVGQPAQVNHYTYMNNLWKHLTETSINLRSRFKSIVKDLKRIVGSKNFTAISLAGAYPCILLIDELKESNNTNLEPGDLTALKNSPAILNCRRGLLPLLVPAEPNSTLFANMVVRLLNIDYQFRLAAAVTPNPDAAVAPNPDAAAKAANDTYSTNNILIFLGFLFSIKIKSSASIGPRNMLSLVDSIINFSSIPPEKLSLDYTGDVNSPVPSTCSLANLSVNPDAGACATGGVEHAGGAPKPAPPKKVDAAAPPKKVDAAAAPIAAGVSKSKAESKPEKNKNEKNKKTVAAEAATVAALRLELLNPTKGPFKKFMDKIYQVLVEKKLFVNQKTCITGSNQKLVFNFGTFYNRPPYTGLRLSLGGSNKKTKSDNKSSKTNNHTRRNKNKRKKNSKSKTKTKFKTKSSPKHRKAIPSSRSGSQSNRKKSKTKKSQKNVTFKRRRARK